MGFLILFLLVIANSFSSSSTPVPIQLVAPDPTRSELKIRPEALKLLSEIPAPIAVVSIVGAVHSGKSFFLNALRGSADGFAVGYTVRPETSGLWMWSEPLNVKGVNILLLDTEGFYAPNVTESYDAKIYSIATLLSSEILYNTVKFIDQQSLEYLELLTRRANIFGLRAFADHPPADATNASVSELIAALLPTSLSWIVQDFVQDLQGQSPLHWLEELIENPKTRFVNGANGSSVPPQHQDEMSTLKNLFKSIDCLTLPPPVGNPDDLQKLDKVDMQFLSPDYTIMLDAYRKRLFHRLEQRPKLRSNKAPMNGDDLAALLNFLVEAANQQKQRFPNVPPVWERFAELQMQYSKSDLLNVYTADTSKIVQSQLPLLESETDVLHRNVSQSILKLFESHIAGHHDPKPTGPSAEVRKSLENELKQRGLDLANLTCKRIQKHCEAARDETLKSIDQHLSTLLAADCPLTSTSLESKLTEVMEKSMSQFRDLITIHGSRPYDKSKCCYNDEFQEMMERRFDVVRTSNERRIDEVLREATDESQSILTSRLSLADSTDVSPNSWKPEIRAIYQTTEINFREILDGTCREAVDVFELAVRPLLNLDKGQAARRSLDLSIVDVRQKAHRRWNDFCVKECASVVDGALIRLPAHVRRTMPLPCLEEHIDQIAAESQKQAEHDFRQIHCADSPSWRLSHEQLLIGLANVVEDLRRQNVESIKDLSRGPLAVLIDELTSTADHHFFWALFKATAKLRAIDVLTAAASRRNLQTTPALIGKVAELFTENDLGLAKDKISRNLFFSLAFHLGVLTLVGGVLSSYLRSQYGRLVILVLTIVVLYIPITRPFSAFLINFEFWILTVVVAISQSTSQFPWWIGTLGLLTIQNFFLWQLCCGHEVITSKTTPACPTPSTVPRYTRPQGYENELRSRLKF